MLKSIVVVLPLALGAIWAQASHAEVAPHAAARHAPVAVRTALVTAPDAFVGAAETASRLPRQAAWTMLMVGFGTTGAVLRLRRRSTSLSLTAA